jgi:hypothetical protein
MVTVAASRSSQPGVRGQHNVAHLANHLILVLSQTIASVVYLHNPSFFFSAVPRPPFSTRVHQRLAQLRSLMRETRHFGQQPSAHHNLF